MEELFGALDSQKTVLGVMHDMKRAIIGLLCSDDEDDCQSCLAATRALKRNQQRSGTGFARLHEGADFDSILTHPALASGKKGGWHADCTDRNRCR